MNFLKKIFKKKPPYVSPVEQFLLEFDKEHPNLSRSQQAEIKKFSRINYLRDHVVKPDDKNKNWEGF